MTPEREAEIRREAKLFHDGRSMLGDALAEIDALRAEIDEAAWCDYRGALAECHSLHCPKHATPAVDTAGDVPECVKRWRKLAARILSGGFRVHIKPLAKAPPSGWPDFNGWARDCLEWLATTPAAVIVAASSGDVERVREWQASLDREYGDVTIGDLAMEIARATIVDSAAHVVLPRAVVAVVCETLRQLPSECSIRSAAAEDSPVWTGATDACHDAVLRKASVALALLEGGDDEQS